MGLFVAALIVVGAVGAFLGTRAAPDRHGRRERADAAGPARAWPARNRPFRVLLICFVVQSAGVATMLAGVNYFADQVLRDPRRGTTAALRLLRRAGAAGDAALDPGRRPARQARRRWSPPR